MKKKRNSENSFKFIFLNELNQIKERERIQILGRLFLIDLTDNSAQIRTEDGKIEIDISLISNIQIKIHEYYQINGIFYKKNENQFQLKAVSMKCMKGINYSVFKFSIQKLREFFGNKN
ncbi:cst complex subunit ten1 [Anaeramoeba ignava]|uniref:Cst complex subunit ten1 n=1 Tax=Anaeramoeba ignava TaxID=1746090 RepID=A0A9Q0LTI2_ANAIG|nr:cst complex subunit ten1 [Anaeramoeba ignava]